MGDGNSSVTVRVADPDQDDAVVSALLVDYLTWAVQPAGVGALRRLADDTVEVKRMFVAPACRAHHVGSAILDRLLMEAQLTMSATTVRLDTCRFMSDAQRLYRSRGFVERAPYAGTEIPADLQHYWLFFEKALSPPAK